MEGNSVSPRSSEGHAYAYLRVSTKEQNLARQYAALEPLGISPNRIYVDTRSGKDFNRPAYRKLIRKLKPGDTLYVKSIDRLGRNYDEIQDQWRILTRDIGVFMVVLDMPLLDTRVRSETLTGAFIADLVLQILSYVAETERSHIRERQREGIAAAKARGVHFGPPRYELDAEVFAECSKAYSAGKMTAEEAAKRLSVSSRTFLRRYSELKHKNRFSSNG
ncbi:MAG TPA: recombinase family protein, partial [Methanocorpusculum sp.]|nr:recombinase family protein [Methanocorpusculum sp.]